MNKTVQVAITMHPDGRVEVNATTNQPAVVLWMIEKAKGAVLGQGQHQQQKAPMVHGVRLMPKFGANGG